MIFTPRGTPPDPPVARLRGEISKIASMTLKALTQGPTVQNFMYVAPSMMAVGGVALKKGTNIF